MSQPYVGEIRMFGGNFAPADWALCDGRLLAIADSEVLFQLIGTTYGGDGQQTFAVPDLRGRVPIHQGNNAGQSYTMGQQAGVERVALTTPQLPPHNHAIGASTAAPPLAPDGLDITSGAPYVPATFAAKPKAYASPGAALAMNAAAISADGANAAHENMAPFLCVNFIISLYGIFPSPT
jgi:microcystin-dependent protein